MAGFSAASFSGADGGFSVLAVYEDALTIAEQGGIALSPSVMAYRSAAFSGAADLALSPSVVTDRSIAIGAAGDVAAARTLDIPLAVSLGGAGSFLPLILVNKDFISDKDIDAIDYTGFDDSEFPVYTFDLDP